MTSMDASITVSLNNALYKISKVMNSIKVFFSRITVKTDRFTQLLYTKIKHNLFCTSTILTISCIGKAAIEIKKKSRLVRDMQENGMLGKTQEVAIEPSASLILFLCDVLVSKSILQSVPYHHLKHLCIPCQPCANERGEFRP